MSREEHQIQSAAVKRFKMKYPKFHMCLFAIPNGAVLSGGAKQWNYLAAEGALPGVSDLFLAVPASVYSGLFLEVKTEKGSLTVNQRSFLKAVRDIGYDTKVCKGVDALDKALDEHMELYFECAKIRGE